ncbi:hypothetical protein B0H17DRAFT_478539 [Mycena rosella]|uniref:Uncharacterized protein n=1 Tax=Mycena rosella TaxID=1033263 RepID=A0AAD7C6C8_MYCRO|nr:hypothetical protein B0H17DRAFT_478539 [Mycena rosella]
MAPLEPRTKCALTILAGWRSPPDDFADALDFEPTEEQFSAWIASGVDVRGVHDGDAASILTEFSCVESVSGKEEKAPSQPVDSFSNSLLLPRPSNKKLRKAVASLHVPCNNPTLDNSHLTAPTSHCAFLYAHDRLRCCASRRTQLLRCAPLVSPRTGPATHRQIELAIGGRFRRNSRLNYLVLAPDHQSDLEDHLVLVYPTEPHVLRAVEAYLAWLDAHDARDPLTRVDYLQLLRTTHPILVRPFNFPLVPPRLSQFLPMQSDGHEYKLRYISICDDPLPLYVVVRTPSSEQSHTIYEPLFPTLPLTSTFASPLFVTLNAIRHIDARFPDVQWDWDTPAWAAWIAEQPALAHLREIQKLSGDGEGEGGGQGATRGAVEELAAFLAVAAHLRHRLGPDFVWEPPTGGSESSASESSTVRAMVA